jgi:hypothetical protein
MMKSFHLVHRLDGSRLELFRIRPVRQANLDAERVGWKSLGFSEKGSNTMYFEFDGLSRIDAILRAS